MGRGARRHRRAHPQGDRREPPARDHVSRRPARARTATRTACCRRGASTATTATPTSAPRRRGSAIFCGAATTGRRPTTPTRRRSCCCRRTSRPATTSTRTRSGSSKGKPNGATLIVIDPRLSNTSAKADLWLPAYSGTEGALLLAMVNVLLDEELYDREFVRDWVELARLPARRATRIWPSTFDNFIAALKELYAQFTPEFAADETGVAADADRRGGARHRPRRQPLQHAQLARRPRPATCGAGRSRAASTCSSCSPAAVGTERRRRPARLEQVRPEASDAAAAARRTGTSCCSRREYPLAFFEMSFLLPHFLKEGRGKLDVYFTRVYNPVWTNPGRLLVDGGAAATRQDRPARRAHADLERDGVVRRLHPADGARHRAPRHDEPGDARRRSGSASASRCCASRARSAARRSTPRYEANPGEVWEENEFWIALSLAHRSRRRARHPQALRVARTVPASR